LSMETAHGIEEKKQWHWYHGLLFYLLMQVLAFGLSTLVSRLSRRRVNNLRELFGDTAYFKSLKQVKITPPSWAFGPAWTINNVSVIWGLLRVLQKPERTEGRTAYLQLQALSWLNYIIFNAAYFGLRSPINAFLLTLSMLILTILSGWVALFRLRDSLVALSLATLFLWLLIALTAASFQVLWNRDEFYSAGPFARPVPALVKAEVA
jgi:tryptophan-rich sensory protein